jgi:hypothetical protein
MKVLFGMALRQTTGFVESLLHLIGLDREVPDFSTLSRRQKTLAVNIPHRGSQGPLHLLIDIEPVNATDGVDGSRSLHRNVPHWVLSHQPMKGAIHEGDYHCRAGSCQDRVPGPRG